MQKEKKHELGLLDISSCFFRCESIDVLCEELEREATRD